MQTLQHGNVLVAEVAKMLARERQSQYRMVYTPESMWKNVWDAGCVQKPVRHPLLRLW